MGRARRLALAVLFVAGPVAAGPVRFLEPRPGDELVAGRDVTVRWSSLPEGTREFELLLLLGEGGRTVRLTECLDPSRTSFRWRVPSLPSDEARLVLRLSRGRGEESGAVGPAVRIVPSRSVTLSPVAFTRGEWWLASAAPGTAEPLEPRGRLAAGARQARLLLEPFGVPGRPEPAAPPTARPAGPHPAMHRPGGPDRLSGAASRRPLSTPQRE